MTSIHILPEHLANQIAAGEVVQRPESIVKELVENAIDAGATSVTVVVREGGMQSIHVIDNGAGMSKDDLVLSIVRHATSKIICEDDLHAIRTLGFRGEALASIAAVAEVEIETCRQGDSAGWVLFSKPGQPPVMKAAIQRTGTSIKVSNVFANVPARRKFLKSALTEFRYISELMQRLALARPDVRFVLYDGPSVVLDLTPESAQERFVHVLKIASNDVVMIDHREGGVWLRGCIGGSKVVRHNRSGQYLFLNARSIQSRSLSFAVAQCYEHVLREKEHPVFALWMDIDPERIDVNIHPQKHEVKFDDERAVFLAVQNAVTQALTQAHVIPSLPEFLPFTHKPLQSLEGLPEGHVAVNRLTGEILDRRGPTGEGDPFSAVPRISGEMHRSFEQLMTAPPQPDKPVVLMVERGFALCRHEDGIMVVRLYPCLERVFYERMFSSRTAQTNQPEHLLFPVTIDASPLLVSLAQEHKDLLHSLGYAVEVQAASVTIVGVPWHVSAGEETAAVHSVLESVEELDVVDKRMREERLMIALAKRQAQVAVAAVTLSTAAETIKELRACTMSHVSPSGSPTYTVLSFEELERRFL